MTIVLVHRAVQAPQDREREDDTAVLVRLVHAAELVRDPPHEVAELAQRDLPFHRSDTRSVSVDACVRRA